MKKLIAPLAASLLLASCAGAPGAASNAADRGVQIPALEAQRYFYGNSHPAPEGGVMKVESAAELSEFFGMATGAQVSGRCNGSLPRCNGIKKGRGLASSVGLGGIPQGGMA